MTRVLTIDYGGQPGRGVLVGAAVGAIVGSLRPLKADDQHQAVMDELKAAGLAQTRRCRLWLIRL